MRDRHSGNDGSRDRDFGPPDVEESKEAAGVIEPSEADEAKASDGDDRLQPAKTLDKDVYLPLAERIKARLERA